MSSDKDFQKRCAILSGTYNNEGFGSRDGL